MCYFTSEWPVKDALDASLRHIHSMNAISELMWEDEEDELS
jgi:hypothetical protein